MRLQDAAQYQNLKVEEKITSLESMKIKYDVIEKLT